MCQVNVCNEGLVDLVARIVDEHKSMPGSLIPILHRLQQELGYLSRETQSLVARHLGVPEVKVSGVVSFYHFFSDKPKGQYEIGVCMGTACYVRGAGVIVEEFEKQLGIKSGETTEDQLFSLGATRCIGACGLAPVVTVNDDVYGRLTADKVEELLDTYRQKG